ncbi:hypothetical protein Plhal304r1_c021g0075801 [Plasmopara halstedii]
MTRFGTGHLLTDAPCISIHTSVNVPRLTDVFMAESEPLEPENKRSWVDMHENNKEASEVTLTSEKAMTLTDADKWKKDSE